MPFNQSNMPKLGLWPHFDQSVGYTLCQPWWLICKTIFICVPPVWLNFHLNSLSITPRTLFCFLTQSQSLGIILRSCRGMCNHKDWKRTGNWPQLSTKNGDRGKTNPKLCVQCRCWHCSHMLASLTLIIIFWDPMFVPHMDDGYRL